MSQAATPTVRYATLADAALLNELGLRTFIETFAHFNRAEDMDAYTSEAFTVERLTAELLDPLATFLIAEVDGLPVGYAKLYEGEAPDCVTGAGPVELARLYVLQDYYGRGVGQALMDGCLNNARAKCYQSIFLGVWEHNERAKAFYRKWGFEHIGDHEFILGRDVQNDWWMERAL